MTAESGIFFMWNPVTHTLGHFLRDFPTEYPLSYKQLACEQGRDNDLQSRFTKEPEKCKKQTFRYSDKSYELITREDKIVLPLEEAAATSS